MILVPRWFYLEQHYLPGTSVTKSQDTPMKFKFTVEIVTNDTNPTTWTCVSR